METSELINEIVATNPLQKKFLQNSVDQLNDEHRKGLQDYLSFCIKQGKSITFLANAYNFIVKETMREQMYFRKHKKYRYSFYHEVSGSVYLNEEYMSKYMYGLAITSFLWKQHQLIHSFFEQVLPHNKNGNFLEIGPGHGFYFMHALRSTQFDHFTAIDLSPTSVEMTKAIVTANMKNIYSENWNIYECDFLEMKSDEKFDGLVMGEVLEHVEKPLAFLEKIHSIVNEDSFVYITTCANAPEIDHLFLFRNDQEVTDMVRQAGFEIDKQLVVPYGDYTVAETIDKALPLNIALSLKKK